MNVETLSFEYLHSLEAQISPEFVKVLIETFLKEAPRQFHQMRSFSDVYNLPEVREVAHSMKSTFGNLGCQVARETCHQIEIEAMQKNELRVQVLIGSLEEELQQTINLLSHYKDRRS